jgi:hypothetical protein
MCNAAKLKIVEIISFAIAMDCPKCGSSHSKKNGFRRGYPPGIVLIDAGYGNNTTFLKKLEQLS